MTDNPDTDAGGCPVCESPYVKRVISKFGGTLNHRTQIKQDRTCFWPHDHADDTAAVAVYYHVDELPDDETIDLTHGDD